MFEWSALCTTSRGLNLGEQLVAWMHHVGPQQLQKLHHWQARHGQVQGWQQSADDSGVCTLSKMMCMPRTCACCVSRKGGTDQGGCHACKAACCQPGRDAELPFLILEPPLQDFIGVQLCGAIWDNPQDLHDSSFMEESCVQHIWLPSCPLGILHVVKQQSTRPGWQSSMTVHQDSCAADMLHQFPTQEAIWYLSLDMNGCIMLYEPCNINIHDEVQQGGYN